MGAMMPGMRQEARNRILLRIDDLKLMLPQAEVCAVESVSDLDWQEAQAPVIAHIAYLGKRWPVVCLNAEFQAQDKIPPGRRACVMLATGKGFMGLLCDDVRVLNQVGGEDYALPVAMRTAGTPIQALMHFEDGLACLSDASHLMQSGVLAQVLQMSGR